jgi:hypothetical protein
VLLLSLLKLLLVVLVLPLQASLLQELLPPVLLLLLVLQANTDVWMLAVVEGQQCGTSCMYFKSTSSMNGCISCWTSASKTWLLLLQLRLLLLLVQPIAASALRSFLLPLVPLLPPVAVEWEPCKLSLAGAYLRLKALSSNGNSSSNTACNKKLHASHIPFDSQITFNFPTSAGFGALSCPTVLSATAAVAMSAAAPVSLEALSAESAVPLPDQESSAASAAAASLHAATARAKRQEPSSSAMKASSSCVESTLKSTAVFFAPDSAEDTSEAAAAAAGLGAASAGGGDDAEAVSAANGVLSLVTGVDAEAETPQAAREAGPP